MKAVRVAGGSPDGPEEEGTEVAATESGTAGTTAPAGGGPDATEAPAGTGDPERAGTPDAENDGPEEPSAEAAAGTAAEADADPDTGGALPRGGTGDATPEEPEADAGVDENDAAPAAGQDAPAAPRREGTADATDEAEPDARTAGKAAPAAAPDATDEAEPKAEPGTPTEAKADADAEDEPHTKADAEAETGPADAEDEPAARPGADAPPAARPQAKAEGDTKAAGADAKDEAGTNQADTEPEARAKADGDTKTGRADAKDEPQAKTDAETARADAKDEPGPQAKADAETGPADAKPEARPQAKADADAETARADTKDEAGAKTPADAEPETQTQTEAKAQTDAEPRRADAEAKTQADPDAEGTGEAGAGPAGQRVPSWARDAGHDPERTSRFVALKDLDSPAPAKAPVPPQTRTPAPASARPAVVEPTREAPLPPLDLLAELTNTAPPPETPRRTALRRVKVWTPILLLLAGAAAGAQLLRPLPSPQIVAAAQTHTVDGQFSVPWPAKGQGAVRVPGSGDIGTFGEQKPVPTASVAKVMTAYVVLKGHPLRKGEAGPQIVVDAKAVEEGTSENESRIEGLTVGAKFSQQDMLKMLMIPSGNNAARLLARWDTGTGSEAAFVEKMNAAAKELGMKDTTYTDPSGLDAGTVSTATDQLKLAEAVMKDEVFRAIVALPSAEIKGLPKAIQNNNDLLTVNGLSVRGIKTGSSTPAGGALMWAAYKSVGDETPLILGTLMEQRVDGPDLNAENSLKLVKANSRKIIEAVRGALASTPVVRKGQVVGHVDDGLGGRTPLVATKDLNVIGVPGQQLTLTLRGGSSPTPHTAKAGSELGVLTVGDGEGAKSIPVAVQGALAEPSFGTRITRLG
ncbi:serine hydrolase [Streptomyces sp. NPDC058646]|uniref:serine hydrolase n=1 Tax=Streptomyces sp. NPDC058646 TaxID=3346574 RepID=UPI003648BECE